MPAGKRRPLRSVVSISLPAESARLVVRAAAIRHQRPSVFLRDAAIREANRVLGIEQPTAVTPDLTLADAGAGVSDVAAVA